MKQIRLKPIFLAALLSGLMPTACAAENTGSSQPAAEASTSQTVQSAPEEQTRGAVHAEEELPFPMGQQVSGEFTGSAYLEPMIMNDDIYHFPQTNHITFEPGARSYWHSHGGMVIIGTGGVAITRRRASPPRSSGRGMWCSAPKGRFTGMEPPRTTGFPSW